MSRLSKLYDAIETLRKEGVSTDDLEEKVSQAEEDIIKKEILPILTQNIEPALQQVKRELVLVVDYQPGQPISVHLSRKRNFTAEIADAKEIVQDPIVEHGERKTKQEKIRRSSPSDMAVFFPDGTTTRFRSQRKCAAMLEVSPFTIHKHINDGKPDYKGRFYDYAT